MKRLYFTFALLALALTGMAQVKMLKPYYSVTTYNVPDSIAYVENAVAIDCQSATYKEFQPGMFKATVEITTMFKQGESYPSYSKVAVDSPVVTDTSKIDGAFINQQRFPLPKGEYEMILAVRDLNAVEGRTMNDTLTVEVNYEKNVPAISDILLYDSYTQVSKPSACTKSGLDFLPRVYPFYGSKETKLNFYVELYNSNKLYDEGKYLVNYYIETCESSTRLQDYAFVKRFPVAPVNVHLGSIDISSLPSGNYYLVVEMRDRSNALICSKSIRFFRSNPGASYDMYDLSAVGIEASFVSQINNIDSIRKYIRYLDPICSEVERDYSVNLVKTDDLKTMQQFFLNFWNSRSPLNPRSAWEDYLAAVRRVNMSFGTVSYPGYRTDRGYVFLKYGQPDKIVESPNEPGAYPYEIWHYYEVANQHNKRFVFMSKDNVTNDFHLIHSDVIGEINNPRWQLEIYSRINGNITDGVDQTEYEGGWGTHARDLYDNPR